MKTEGKCELSYNKPWFGDPHCFIRFSQRLIFYLFSLLEVGKPHWMDQVNPEESTDNFLGFALNCANQTNHTLSDIESENHKESYAVCLLLRRFEKDLHSTISNQPNTTFICTRFKDFKTGCWCCKAIDIDATPDYYYPNEFRVNMPPLKCIQVSASTLI